jgi:hypothetical protein
MSFDSTPVVSTDIGGRRTTVWLIDERSVGEDALWSIHGLPHTFTITLLETLLVEAGSEDTLLPEILVGAVSGDDDDDKLTVWQCTEPASIVRSGTDLRVCAPNGVLYGRSHASVVGDETAGNVLTRITIVEGH